MRKILIIKFSAIGDVVESLPVAAALKELYKDGCEITWITKKCHMCLLENNEFIESSPKSCVKLSAQYLMVLHLDIISRSIFPLFRLIYQ